MTSVNKSLAGRTALVTGGSRGIGKAISLELAARGADISFNYLRSHDAARAVEAEIAALGVGVLRHRANLADDEAISGLLHAVVEKFGKIDILVNNAASGVMRSAAELTEKHWDWTQSVNAKAPVADRGVGVGTYAGGIECDQHLVSWIDQGFAAVFRRGGFQSGVGRGHAVHGDRSGGSGYFSERGLCGICGYRRLGCVPGGVGDS